ncbi:MAG: hypothetical protein ABI136_02705, partial [Ginsengibacter sp.]
KCYSGMGLNRILEIWKLTASSIKMTTKFMTKLRKSGILFLIRYHNTGTGEAFIWYEKIALKAVLLSVKGLGLLAAEAAINEV